jgi:hypothetical protein
MHQQYPEQYEQCCIHLIRLLHQLEVELTEERLFDRMQQRFKHQYQELNSVGNQGYHY